MADMQVDHLQILIFFDSCGCNDYTIWYRLVGPVSADGPLCHNSMIPVMGCLSQGLASAGKLSEAEEAELLDNMRLAAPSMDAALVELLCMWARRGRTPEAASFKVCLTAFTLPALRQVCRTIH